MIFPLHILLFLLAPLCGATKMWPPHFGSHAWGSAIVVPNWLIIDGGELYTTAPGNGSFSILGSTFAIDLSTSWTNATFSYVYVDKPPSYPFARAESIWYDSLSKNLYTRGGWQYELDNCLNEVGSYQCSPQIWLSGLGFEVISHFNKPVPQTVWQIHLNDLESSNIFSGNNYWIETPFHQTSSKPNSLVLQPPADSEAPFGALEVGTPNTYYSLGGCLAFANNDPAWALPGLLKLELQTGEWSNYTETNYSYGGYGAFGEGIFVQMYGQKGVLVFFGGYSPPEQRFEWGGDADPLQPMSQINIYDIASGRFLKQVATGEIPGARWGSCGVGVQDSNRAGFDIFIYGGFVTSQGGPYVESYTDVYVLSIPSFHWMRVKRHPHTSMRALHSCAIIGKRQMVVVGGISSTAALWVDSPDPWQNGIGVFDMTALRWTPRYDANAEPYERAPSLATQNRLKPYPRTWGDGVRQIFQKPSRKHIVIENNDDSGAIAGGVIGGIVGLLLCIIMAYYFVHRRRKPRVHNGENAFHTHWFLDKPELPSQNELSTPMIQEDIHRRVSEIGTSDIGTSAVSREEARVLTSEAQELEA